MKKNKKKKRHQSLVRSLHPPCSFSMDYNLTSLNPKELQATKGGRGKRKKKCVLNKILSLILSASRELPQALDVDVLDMLANWSFSQLTV
jgi:hypothetical protein